MDQRLKSAFRMIAFGCLAAICAAAQTDNNSNLLPSTHFTIKSLKKVDLSNNTATLPLYKGKVGGTTVWYVITDVSDRGIAKELGVNFAPRLKNAGTGCPGCIQEVKSDKKVLGKDDVEFKGMIDFKAKRIFVPGPTGFPPLGAQPGAMGDMKYSPLVRIEGTDAVYNAPMVATGDGDFDVKEHKNTGDRVMRIDKDAMTVDLLFIRAFSNGKDIFYFNFEASDPGDAVIERSAFVPGLGLLPFAGASDDPKGTRNAIFAFANGKLGKISPPAQGLAHVAIDGKLTEEANLENSDLIAALVAGGDSHNVLDFFPTLSDPKMAELYSPIWDLHVAVWSPKAVSQGLNVAQKDANQIRQLAAKGMVTSPGGGPLGSANHIINCPVLGFLNDAPSRPQVPEPPPKPGRIAQ